ncbi:MAG: cob(I)yrinic acid a,c-diamide adenosyltransferase [Planctomycetota bacterium]
MSDERRSPGRILLFTGDGKGKTSAALGLGLRALGHDLRVSVIQFIKSRRDVGEVEAAQRLGDRFEILPCGRGFVTEPGGTPEDRAAARAGLELAREKAADCDVLILDEVHEAIRLGLFDAGDVLGLLRGKPAGLHVVLTGRGAPDELIDAADTVTEMANVKHAFDAGTDAAEGIEF